MKTKLCDSPTFLPPSPLLSLFNYANGRVPQPGERCTPPLFLRSPSWPMTAKTRPAHCCQLQCGPLPPREERRGEERRRGLSFYLSKAIRRTRPGIISLGEVERWLPAASIRSDTDTRVSKGCERSRTPASTRVQLVILCRIRFFRIFLLNFRSRTPLDAVLFHPYNPLLREIHPRMYGFFKHGPYSGWFNGTRRDSVSSSLVVSIDNETYFEN